VPLKAPVKVLELVACDGIDEYPLAGQVDSIAIRFRTAPVALLALSDRVRRWAFSELMSARLNRCTCFSSDVANQTTEGLASSASRSTKPSTTRAADRGRRWLLSVCPMAL
jgi:hypothetical protein